MKIKTKTAQGAKPATKRLNPNAPEVVAAARKFNADMREAFAKHTGRVEIYLPGGAQLTGTVPEIAHFFAWYCAELNLAD